MKYYIGKVPANPDYLQHWGLLGMKWGLRRYRNPDGTLTEEGKQRYYGSTRKDVVKALSDSDLDTHTRRLQKENYYIETARRNKSLTESRISKGMKAVGKAMKEVAWDMVSTANMAVAAIGRAYVKSLYSALKSNNGDGKDKKKRDGE